MCFNPKKSIHLYITKYKIAGAEIVTNRIQYTWKFSWYVYFTDMSLVRIFTF